MTGQLNIISIFCNVFSDIIDHSKKPDSSQLAFKDHISDLFSIAFEHIGQTNRIILMTRNGAAIAYMGSPAEAMLMAMDIRNGISIANKPGSAPLSVCIGIHLEPVRLENEFNQQSNIVEDGINAAKRMMSHAKPNEILVSHSYYENIPPSTQALSTLFDDSGVKHEHHVLDLAGLNQDQEAVPTNLELPIISTDSLKSSESSGFLHSIGWSHALVGLFILIALGALFAITKLPTAPLEMPNKTAKNIPLEAVQPPNLNTLAVKPEIPLEQVQPPNLNTVEVKPELPLEHTQPSNFNTLSVEPDIPLKKAHVNGKGNAFMQEKSNPTGSVKASLAKKEVKPENESSADVTSTQDEPEEIISWKILKKSMKQGQKHACTRAEIAMNQCR